MRFKNNPSLLFLLLLSLLSQPLWAEESKANADTEQSESTPAAIPQTLKSPRATMETFLHAMNDIKRGAPERIDAAITTLDLSAINSLVRKEQGSDLAWMLIEVMDRTRVVDLKKVPNYSDGPTYLFHSYEHGDIRIARTESGAWLFDQNTISQLPAIMDEVAETQRVDGKQAESSKIPWHIRFRQQIPASFKATTFLLPNWQWLGLLFTIMLGVVADKLLSFFLRSGVRRWRNRTKHPEFKEISADILRPLGLMAMALIWWSGINLMGLSENVMLILLVAVKFLASISGVWAAYRLVDLVSAFLHKRAQMTENKLDDALVPLIPRTLKIFVTVIGFVFIADNLNVDISSLLAGLGLGGLAFALAAKDMVQNLFGSVTVLMDRTFSVGDWIVVDGVEGSVERIGFRSTRIRTFYNSVVTVPNSKFITATVDNMGERRYRRLSCKLSLTYDTPPDRIEAFCEGVRELVRQHPYMRKDYYQVYLNEFAASSLDVLLYVFWETPEWNTELRERHRFMLDILRLAQGLGVEFAFPTQTLYMKQEEGDGSGSDEMSQSKAQQLGQSLAQQIVADTTGTGVKPPPVTFP
ncbi:MAG: mechanosensitive ion channel family protein [Candidatus Thiodiazotropha taylori]|nr:mechanosensitive ion channel family protein [Candidatus Thiodiazotropha taylori]MCG8107098.1 mechanosensitive ion channel family protein [Candidatus Thiodiazotropha taylori]MCG8110577.1 mechanosensitive ion channel family protein [Candidatus Thiodiazotropha taylori]MCW4279435.1 mechanosensitive ion channel family protein [Candidatus Thiodiazotropha taylori]MCW4282927.1 mechanosensitive ion channel family protein [Candidatus Thiodiazotropha taylori]